MTTTVVTPLSLFDASDDEFGELLKDQPNYRLKQILEARYRDHCFPWELTSLPKALRLQLQETFQPGLASVTEISTDRDTTIKALVRYPDGATVETVLMIYPTRTTVCISSQAGCAMGCVFCATGQAGYDRQLTAGEMEQQYVWAARRVRDLSLGSRPSNIVMMGMGEPLANYDNVQGFLTSLNSSYGVGARSITISTVGIVPGIRRLTQDPRQFNLAVSLHAPSDDLRSTIVPINRRYGLVQLMTALKEYRAHTRRRITFEYAMMAEINDSQGQATLLASLALELQAHVNLIPLNPTPSFDTPGSSANVIRSFASTLERSGVNVTIRDTRGSDIAAACGQLAAVTPTTKVSLRKRDLEQQARAATTDPPIGQS
jgi:23S rRNA (adenine2503-C2)-methyltransferase